MAALCCKATATDKINKWKKLDIGENVADMHIIGLVQYIIVGPLPIPWDDESFRINIKVIICKTIAK